MRTHFQPPVAGQRPKSVLTRRRALQIGTVSLAAPLIVGRASAATRKVKLMLSWLPEGSYAYNFVAKEKGFWEKRGLDVEISRGYGSLPSARAVADGQIDFGLSNPASLILLGAKGVDLRMIGLMDYSSFMGVGLLADSPIREPRDLEGQKIGQTMASSDAAFFPVFCDKAGVDIGKVERLNVDAKVRNQSLANGQIPAITGLVSSMLPSIGPLGINTRYMLYDDYGVDLYGNIGVSVRPQMMEEEPELCQAFMDGLTEGLRYTLTNIDDAKETFLKAVPELRMTPTGEKFAELGIAVQRASVLSAPDPRSHGLGYADPDRLAAAADMVMTYQADPGDTLPDLGKLFTNQFIGKTTLSDAEWAEADAKTAEIRATIKG